MCGQCGLEVHVLAPWLALDSCWGVSPCPTVVLLQPRPVHTGHMIAQLSHKAGPGPWVDSCPPPRLITDAPTWQSVPGWPHARSEHHLPGYLNPRHEVSAGRAALRCPLGGALRSHPFGSEHARRGSSAPCCGVCAACCGLHGATSMADTATGEVLGGWCRRKVGSCGPLTCVLHAVRPTAMRGDVARVSASQTWRRMCSAVGGARSGSPNRHNRRGVTPGWCD